LKAIPPRLALKAFLRWLRHTTVWVGPTLVLLLAVIGGFLGWTLGTEQGARWLLVTVARQFGGDARDVHGSVLQGLRVGSLELSLPEVSIQLRDAQLDVDWNALSERRLHVRNLSAQDLALVVNSAASPPAQASESVDLTTLPLTVQLDQLNLGSLDVRVNGQTLVLHVDAVELAANLTRAGNLTVRRLALEHADARIDDAPLPVRLDAVELTASLADLRGARGSLTLHRLALAHALANVTLQGDVAWELDDALILQTADANLRLLDLRVSDEKLPLQVDALELAAHATRASGSVILRKLALRHPLGDVALQADAAWELDDHGNGFDVKTAALDVQLLDGTRWNDQPLRGALHAQARHTPSSSPALHDVMQTWTLPELALDLTLGANHIVLDGALGQAADRLKLQASIPVLAEFLPELAGSLHMQAQVQGNVTQHMAELEAVFTPADGTIPFGQDPVRATLAFTGTWEGGQAQGGKPQESQQQDSGEPQKTRNPAWRAQITQLQVNYAALQANIEPPLELVWQAQPADWQWRIGATRLRLSQNQQLVFTLDHQQSRLGGRPGWETRGSIAQLHVTDARIAQVRELLNLVNPSSPSTGGGVTDSTARDAQIVNDIYLATDWQLRFTDTLEGQWNVRRSSGDLTIPWEPPIAVGLRDLRLSVNATRIAAASSQLRGTLAVETNTMGSLSLQASTRLRGDWQLDTPDATVIDVRTETADLGWLSLFSNLPVELGGAVTAQLNVQHRPDGNWATQGRVTGKGLRIIYPDEGVRLLDGTLSAHFDGERFVLEGLRFPARLRVEPKEWRTREWVKTDPDAQNGSLTLSGDWHLRDSIGRVQVALHRYPLLQRSDRHVMLSGALEVNAALDASKITIAGNLTADAGWFDLDIVSGVPTLDNDVVVHRAGDAVAASRSVSPADVAVDVTIDLGSRFYLTGYGLDSGLEGKIRLRMQDGRLRADGALNTRGGIVSAYGQQLRLFRGNVTFQGDVASPVLDIIAMRSGDVAVRAGVRVAGTANRPRINLISTPDVNDVEKLSWLLLGRGPDNAGGDAALLLSVGASFLNGGRGEPFYRQFGLDELSMRSGALGATGSLLPVESVVRSLDAGVSDIERQFIVASKNISQGFTVSVEQALSDTGTVGRISYRLARGLNASLSLGTVNGLALVYRWFSRED